MSKLDVVHELQSSFQVVCSRGEQMSSSVLFLVRVKSQRASSSYPTEGGERMLPPVRPTLITLLTLGLLYRCSVCVHCQPVRNVFAFISFLWQSEHFNSLCHLFLD